MQVAVYFNLHTHLWSVKSLEGAHKGLVVAHAGRILLTDVSFKVNEKARLNVLRKQCKNVHAFVIGHLAAIEQATWRYTEQQHVPQAWPDIADEDKLFITYNPYRHSSFVERQSQEKVDVFDWVVMDSDRRVFADKRKPGPIDNPYYCVFMPATHNWVSAQAQRP